MNKVYLCDCMEFMRDLPDNHYDLAIVDPPYGLPDKSKRGAGRLKERAIQGMYDKGWDHAPNQAYFKELFRVSRNQIIWGGNYFTLPPTRGFVVWDKLQPWPNFAACEFAWNSIDGVAKLFRFDNRTGGKIHPTQKPVALYKWLLQNYAKIGYTILDTHVGSGSSRIACHDMGIGFEGCEVDPEYHAAQEARYARHISQLEMFSGEEIQGIIFNKESVK